MSRRAGIGRSGGMRPLAATSSSSDNIDNEDEDASMIDLTHDPISASLDAEFEGGQWINGEFFYTAKRERRHQTKEEQIYGYDEEADRQFYAEQRQQKRPKKIAGGIAFVLGATLNPEKNAAELKNSAVPAAASSSSAAFSSTSFKPASSSTAASTTVTEDGPIAMDESEDGDTKEVSFQELRQAKHQQAAAASSAISSRAARQRERDEAEEGERQTAGRGDFRGAGFDTNLGTLPNAAHSSSSAAASASPFASRPPPAKVDKDFGAFNRHGTGFGLKMLSMLGFRPGDRLGKHGNGVATPIVALPRPASMGLGFGNRKEVDKSHMARNANEEAEFARTKEDEKAKVAKEKQEKAAQQAAWKKDGKNTQGGKRKQKTVYKTAAEMLAADTQSTSGVTPMVVMDYRGPTAKLTSLDAISSTIDDSSTAQPQMLPELQHNLRLLVGMAETSLRNTERERQALRKHLEQLQQQKEMLALQVEHEEKLITQLDAIKTTIHATAKQLKSIPVNATNSLKSRIDLVVTLMRTLQSKYPREYVQYDLPHRAVPMIYPLLKELIDQWKPFESTSAEKQEEKNDAGTKDDDVQILKSTASPPLPVLEIFSQFRPILSNTHTNNHRASSSSSSLYQQYLEELFLPKLRLEISQVHVSIRNTTQILALLRSIHSLCTKELHAHILSHLIYPKLAHELNSWNARVDRQPLHEWILPYADVLPDELMQKLYDVVRSKFALILQQWSAQDLSVIPVLAPWMTHFKPEAFDALLMRAILPKIHIMMKDITREQVKTDSKVLHTVFPWLNLLAGAASSLPSSSSSSRYSFTSIPLNPVVHQLRTFFLVDFFPRWFAALYELLTAADDFDPSWYQSWKDQFPASILADSTIRSCFTRGLDLMNLAMDDLPIEKVYQQIVVWLQSAHLQPSSAASSTSASTAGSKPTSRSSVLSSSFSALSSSSARTFATSIDEENAADSIFISKILDLATLHGIEFNPAVRKGRVNGKQIYMFGQAQVYISQEVVFIKQNDTPQQQQIWRPISLADLLARTNNNTQQQTSATQQKATISDPTPSARSATATTMQDVD